MKLKFRRWFFIFTVLALMILHLNGAGVAEALTSVPHTFTSGETARASEVNENFKALADSVDAIPAGPEGPVGPRGIQGVAGTDGLDGTSAPDTAEQVRKKFFSAACEGNDATDIMVRVGPLCVDRYEAVVVDENSLPLGQTANDYPCNKNGNDCSDATVSSNIFARSEEGVIPSRFITWFQAQQACANSGKRLLTNAEWQMAAAGTDDSGTASDNAPCYIFGDGLSGPVHTGSKTNCTSNWGVNDMVGNLREWVADWMQDHTNSDNGAISQPAFGRDGIFGVDEASPEIHRFPAALVRGGHWHGGDTTGVFALAANIGPAFASSNIGFRCTR